VLLVATSIMVLLGIYADLAFLLQAGLQQVIAVMMHDFWKAEDPQSQMSEQTQSMRNVSLAGGAISLFRVLRPRRRHRHRLHDHGLAVQPVVLRT